MYLKSLTMKGFKSFADPTTLELEPGVTVVVGPNGSGKSNVVDAVAWVLGAQGPRVVRSAKMDDVIFAGTAKRAPLGRAEVSLVIDNSSHELPIDFTEVTITRTLFRSGESEYAINHVPCRLLDVQELLSDSGVGRSQHVIIGQGQLDAILSARPEERRMVIEEAAGILKYRRRRERAVRRLEASESSLNRLQDLLREVRRQMRPLERQAASALVHGDLEAELRAIRLYLAGRELAELDSAETNAARTSTELQRNVAQLSLELEGLDLRASVASDALGSEPAEELTPLVGHLDRLHERARGLLALMDERRRASATLLAALEGQGDVTEVQQSLRRVLEELANSEVEATELAPEWERLAGAEAALIEAEVGHSARYADLSRAGLAEGASLRAAAEQARRRLATLRQDEALARERLTVANRTLGELRARLATARARRLELETAMATARDAAAQAAAGLEGSRQSVAEADAARRVAEEAAHRVEARVEALSFALEEARERADLGRLGELAGLLGTLRDLIVVAPNSELALEAALLDGLDAAVLDGAQALQLAIERLAGRGGSLLPLPERGGEAATAARLPAGCRRLRGDVQASDSRVEALLDAQLRDVVVCPGGVLEALEFAAEHHDLVVVTEAGDRVSRSGIRLSSSAVGASAAALAASTIELDRARVLATTANGQLRSAQGVEEQARRAEQAARTALEGLGAEERSAEREESQLASQIVTLEHEESTATEVLDAALIGLDPVEAEVVALDAQVGALEVGEAAIAERFEEADAARHALDERARALAALRRDLEVRAAALEERRALLGARRDELEHNLAAREAAVAEATRRRAEFDAEDGTLAALMAEVGTLATRLEIHAHDLGAEHDRRLATSRERLEHLGAIRHERERIERELAARREQQQRCEIILAESRIRREAAAESLRRELDVEPAEALAAPRPELAPGSEPAMRARTLERELRELGPVNPLAAEELAALTERGQFLEGQLEDVRSARRELNQVIRAVDTEIVDVFAGAYEDVAANFESLIETLFPGGQGRLSLTAPDDLLETGVEIEARPAGRNVRRLSLLSGGERSLVAMAYLFAVFRSRPSPFYLMDEVEAALDEVNLTRFHDLVNEFRDDAQLIIVSHQKKTMEVADALYGISMQPGGASKVISERVPRPRGASRVEVQSDLQSALELR